MSRRSDYTFQEARHGLRIKDNVPVRWSIKDSNMSGRGKVRNISTSGMLLEAETAFTPIDRCFFAIDATLKGKGDHVPSYGRLVWCQRKAFNNGRVLCGIEFVDPSTDVIAKLRERIQKTITKLANVRRFKSFVSFILAMAMIGMTAFIIKQFSDNYQSLEATNKNMLSSFQMQQSMSKTLDGQLATTKGMLEETEKLLSQAKADAAGMQSRVDALQATVDGTSGKMQSYEAEIARMKEANAELSQRNQQMSGELADLKQKLYLLDDNIASLQEGRDRIVIFKKKIHTIRGKIKGLNRQAYLDKVAAQKERDRLDSLIGNGGYFIRDGRPHTPDQEALKARRNIKIDVQFVD